MTPQNSSDIFSTQLTLLLGFLFIGFCYYCSFLWSKRDMLIKSWNFPGPLNLPVIGAAYIIMVRPKYIVETITKLQEKYPTGFKVWFGNHLLYMLHEPEHIEKILGSNKFVQKDDLYHIIISDHIGDGVFTVDPPKWQKHRKIILPSFNQKILDSFVDVFVEKTMVLSDILSKKGGKEFDIYQTFFSCTLDQFIETALGLKLDLQGKNSEFEYAFDRILKIGFIKSFYLWNHFSIVWKLLGHDRRLQKYLKVLNDQTDSVIKQKMEAMEAKKYRKSSLGCVEKGTNRLPFLDFIMKTGEFNASELKAEVNTFLFGGTDTTATAMCFISACLGMFPDIQQKVYEEVIQILGEDRNPTPDDVSLMVYTERVIREVLRLFPPVPFFLRKITEDVDMGNFIIPKGASTFFGALFIHRNPKYWPDPLKFDPDRFLPEEIAKRLPCNYIPFSYGPRKCLGIKFAMMRLKVIIAILIRKLKFHCEYKRIEDIRIKSTLMLRFQDGAKTTMTPRK